jgi:hypothetical protein
MTTRCWFAAVQLLVFGFILRGGDEPDRKVSEPPQPANRPEVRVRVLAPGDDGLGSTRATPQYRAAYRKAADEAKASLADGRARLFSWGMLGVSNLDPETGLGVMPLAGCVLTAEVLGRTEGNSESVREWIKAHGLPANSLLRWKDELTDLPAFFAAREKAGATIALKIGGPDLRSPDGRFSLRQVATQVKRGILPYVRTVTTVGLEVSEEGTIRGVMTDYWVSDGLIVLAWGPPGAPFAVVKNEGPDGPDFTILHLRPVDWLSGGFSQIEE